MANFGFSRLSVVAPRAALARAEVGNQHPKTCYSARKTEALSEAVADCTLVAGTGTLSRRKPEQPVVPRIHLDRRD